MFQILLIYLLTGIPVLNSLICPASGSHTAADSGLHSLFYCLVMLSLTPQNNMNLGSGLAWNAGPTWPVFLDNSGKDLRIMWSALQGVRVVWVLMFCFDMIWPQNLKLSRGSKTLTHKQTISSQSTLQALQPCVCRPCVQTNARCWLVSAVTPLQTQHTHTLTYTLHLLMVATRGWQGW